MKQKIGQHLDPFFDGFWDQLGSILGGCWRPSWTQVGTKCHQNPTTQLIKKMITFWIALGTDFFRILVDFGAKLGVQDVAALWPFWTYFGS